MKTDLSLDSSSKPFSSLLFAPIVDFPLIDKTQSFTCRRPSLSVTDPGVICETFRKRCNTVVATPVWTKHAVFSKLTLFKVF